MAPRVRRPVHHKFFLNFPQGIVIRQENTLVSSRHPFRVLAETGHLIRRVREEPDFVWEFPMSSAETENVSDRVHVPIVHSSMDRLIVRVNSFTQSQEIELHEESGKLRWEETECVVCMSRMTDPNLPVYQCRKNRHFVCETCVLNMDATTCALTNVKDKCPICRHEDTFFIVKNWNEQVDKLREECPFGCATRYWPIENAFEDHALVCTSIVSRKVEHGKEDGEDGEDEEDGEKD